MLMLGAAPVLVTGCGVKSAYDRLDWIIPGYIDNYITLDAGQRTLLRQRLDAQLRWHRNEQLPHYACQLKALMHDLRHDFTTEKLARHDLALRQAWATLVQRLAPDVARLLATASDAQLQELRANLERKTAEYKSKFVDPPPLTLRTERAATMQKRLRRRIGPLTAEQQQKVGTWGGQIELTGADRLAARQRWPARVDELRAWRHEPARLTQLIEGMLTKPETGRPAEHRDKREVNRKLTAALLIEVTNDLTPRQRQHLQVRVADLAQDFEQLAGLEPGFAGCADLERADDMPRTARHERLPELTQKHRSAPARGFSGSSCGTVRSAQAGYRIVDHDDSIVGTIRRPQCPNAAGA